MSFFRKVIRKLTGSMSSSDTQQKSKSEQEPFITVTDSNVICSYPSLNKTERISWANIDSVAVITTDEGPYICDVFILISDNNGGVAIPQDNDVCQTILDRIFKLPGFDFALFTTAMGSTENKKFNVWNRTN